MTISDKKVVSIDYTLTNNNGEVLDSSNGRGPLDFIFGSGQIISGLEEVLLGKSKGAKFQVNIEPEKAYGLRNDSMMQDIARTQFPEDQQLEVGMEFYAQSPQGNIMVSIAKIEGDVVTIDGNHPLAGVALTFDVEIIDVREATEEEQKHGHVHGQGHEHSHDEGQVCGCGGH